MSVMVYALPHVQRGFVRHIPYYAKVEKKSE